MDKSAKRTYKVTGTVYVEASSIRHAAHIARGTFQMEEGGPTVFVVEERTLSFGSPYLVDLSKSNGQTGYTDKIGGTD